jgi:hypothetical protein
MNVGYDFHPEAEVDFTDIWDFIATDSPDAADRVTDDILKNLMDWLSSPIKVTTAPTSPHAPCDSSASMLTRLPTRRMNSLYG